MNRTYRENRELRILSAIGIILVVAGHLGYSVFDWGGLFPYYSFHVFIFMFISGYFYNPEEEQRILPYLLHKCRTLLLPYFLWNLFYGLLATLLHGAGFSIGQSLSLRTLFLEPFIGGHQFMYNFPAWFVPVLFLIEVINVCMRKVLSLLKLNLDWLILAGCLILGMTTVFLAAGGHVWGLYKIPGRLLFLLPGFQMGYIYRTRLEAHDTLPDGPYFLIVMGVQLLITLCCGGLAFSAVWVTSFANGPVIPYLTVIIGIAFYLRIARILKNIPCLASRMVLIGRHTFSIMMHHMFAFFLVKSVFYVIYRLTPLFEDFDGEMYFSEINFFYLPAGAEAGKWLYLAAGIGLPLLLAMGQARVGRRLGKIFSKED